VLTGSHDWTPASWYYTIGEQQPVAGTVKQQAHASSLLLHAGWPAGLRVASRGAGRRPCGRHRPTPPHGSGRRPRTPRCATAYGCGQPPNCAVRPLQFKALLSIERSFPPRRPFRPPRATCPAASRATSTTPSRPFPRPPAALGECPCPRAWCPAAATRAHHVAARDTHAGARAQGWGRRGVPRPASRTRVGAGDVVRLPCLAHERACGRCPRPPTRRSCRSLQANCHRLPLLESWTNCSVTGQIKPS